MVILDLHKPLYSFCPIQWSETFSTNLCFTLTLKFPPVLIPCRLFGSLFWYIWERFWISPGQGGPHGHFVAKFGILNCTEIFFVKYIEILTTIFDQSLFVPNGGPLFAQTIFSFTLLHTFFLHFAHLSKRLARPVLDFQW